MDEADLECHGFESICKANASVGFVTIILIQFQVTLPSLPQTELFLSASDSS